MAIDPEKRLEDWTQEQIQSYMLGHFKNHVGINLVSNAEPWLDFLFNNLQPGDKFPIQISSGPLLSLRYTTKLPTRLVQAVKEEKIELVVHLPFVLSMYKDYNQLQYQRSYFNELFGYYSSLGIKYRMVFHCGHPAKDMDEETTKANFVKNLYSSVVYMNDYGKLTIENLAYNDWTDWCTCTSLFRRYFVSGELDPTKFGLCFDTEHSFASGQSLEDLMATVDPAYIDVFHLNSAPKGVEFGSGTDLHSYTEIESSIEGCGGTFFYNSKEESEARLKNFLKWTTDRPKILERHLMSIQAKDMEYCNRLLSI